MMVTHVVNIRVDQLDSRRGALHLPLVSLKAALEAAYQTAMLYASSRETNPGFFATAILGEAIPDFEDPSMYWLPLHSQQPLNRRVTLEELRAIGAEEMPFHAYSRPIRTITVSELLGLTELGVCSPGFSEEGIQPSYFAPRDRERFMSIQDRELRFQMYQAYGPSCIFLGRSFPSLDGLSFGTDVGHFQPRWDQGPDTIQNVAPMSKDVNYQWDEGLISLTNSGDLLIARQAGPDTRALFRNVTRISFPKDVQLWPDTQFLERHRDTIFERGPMWKDRRRGDSAP